MRRTTRRPRLVGLTGPRPAADGHWERGRHTGPFGARTYDLYLPARTGRGPLPLVLLLHGCQQSPVPFAQDSGFVRAADRDGFAILAPRQETRHQFQRCWHWYAQAHQLRGAGEPALLTALVEHVRDRAVTEFGTRIDHRQVYVTGLSAGGAMALILAATYPDVFAAAGVHSGTAYRSAARGLGAISAMGALSEPPTDLGLTRQMAPLVVIHGTGDRVVRPTNADRIVDQWLASREHGRRGLDRIRPLAMTSSSVVGGRRCIRTRWYSARGRRMLEYWRVDGLAHAWSGGLREAEYVDPAGPDATDLLLGFFRRHRLPLPELEQEPAWAW